ncbi:MAG: hypothetical protein KAW87_05395, partial [Candidatus Cloacimonetes bacterium]|nr:hypothetical protein [Candidatus Cloacimonadota bacterium]
MFVAVVCNSQENWFWQNGCYLNDVFFINENTGWIVGEGHAIQHTCDGGINWVNQTYITNIDLHSVYFIDENTGWAVGESGLILHT